jgi:Protein of unknown function (DUF1549)/Protein of unknown function (DUF1553)
MIIFSLENSWIRPTTPVVGCLAAICAIVCSGSPSPAAEKKPQKPPAAKPVAPPTPRSVLLTHEAWQNAPMTPLRTGELDQLIGKQLQTEKVQPAARTTDEQFLRRVTLDLTGQLPLPADVTEFVADPNPQKRARLIDRLLDTEDYARHWARFWRDVAAARINDRRGLALLGPFERWLQGQFRINQSWNKIAESMITAEGTCRFDDEGQNGAVFFLASYFGPDAANEQAAETARIFLGIQIQCAQCHDHPSDQWKRVQFHELAGYFARLRERPVRGDGKPAGIELISLPRGEHEMPSKEDPKRRFITPPRFLDGKTPGPNRSDRERRQALALAIVDKSNYWFAAAYVNRIWGELMGQSFYESVDDLGPHKQAVFLTVLTRLTGSFRGTNYNVKALFRALLNTETYQRQIRLGESADQHLHFAAAYPTRLRADALWDSLVGVLGKLPAQQATNPQRPFAAPGGLEGQVKTEFAFDPSLKADEVEGSIPQALVLMNSPLLNQRIQAKGTNLLGRILLAYPDNDEALRMVYLRTLARKPTDREQERCRAYIEKVTNRIEAFEDILWALLNSTEFQTKR